MKHITLIITALMGLFLTAVSQSNPRARHFNTDKGLAVSGYDVVAYFNQSKPLKGDARYAVQYEGIIYRFSSESNKSLFLKDPKKYEPQYGGWCAYAMGATGEKVEIDPETFKIVNGKLYLFYHSWVNNTLTKWNKEEAYLRNNADKNWQNIFH